MPIYEYRCPKCGVFDMMQRITENPLRKCPTCKAKVTKLISNTAFQLKGTGWYVTDYAGKGRSETSESKGDAGKSEGGKSEARKSEGDGNGTKAEAKAESAKTESKAGKSKKEGAAADT